MSSYLVRTGFLLGVLAALGACGNGGGGNGRDGGGGSDSSGKPSTAGSSGAAVGGAPVSPAGGKNGSGGAGGVGGSEAANGGASAELGAISLTPASARVAPGERVKFTAIVTGIANTGVAWAVQEGDDGGTIDSAGLYTAPESSGTFHVTASSSSDSTLTAVAKVVVATSSGTPPVLMPGVWADITPADAGLKCCTGGGGNSYGVQFIEIDPSEPRTIYTGIDNLGLWRSRDGGSTWAALGSPAQQDQSGGLSTGYLDTPIRLRVDPNDSEHLYCTQGVHGSTFGFWVSNDGGATWKMPDGFASIASSKATRDVTMMAVDPSDFKHVLLASHSAWKDLGNAGILETSDGGDTWVAHAPEAAWPIGTAGISFLYDPASGVGDAKTWLFGTDGNGFWRTTDGGATWKKVDDSGIPHGGHDIYYSPTGALYAGATPYPLRSRDNGATWEQLKTAPFSYFYSVVGDGTTLFTAPAFTGTNGGDPGPFWMASEQDGDDWKIMPGGQKFVDGPQMLRYDAANGIMYSATWGAGVLALKTGK